MFGWEFPPYINGGLAVACYGLTKALVGRGIHVTFVLPVVRPGAGAHTHVTLVGANQVRFEDARLRLDEFRESVRFEFVDALLEPYLTESAYRRLLFEFRRQFGHAEGGRSFHFTFSGEYGPDLLAEVSRYGLAAGAIAARVPHDLIHVHDWLTVPAGLTARRVSGKPLIYHVHALEFDRSGVHVNQRIYDIERLGLWEADRVIAVSHYTKEQAVRHYGIPPGKVEVVHNAVTPTQYSDSPHAGPREKIVLFLGRITFQKGPDYFVEAAARVLKHRPNVRFVMAGSGDMTPRMIERVAQLKIGRHFHFTGFLRGPEVEKMYAISDIYVMPSVSEPFGISPLDALRHNVPVIVSKQSGVAEILKHALKVDFWDIDDIANKIIALLDRAPLREEIVAQGERELRDIQWDKAGERAEAVYRSLAG